MYEHPDFPTDELRLDVKKGKHVPGEKVLEYLELFIQENDLKDLIRSNTKVVVAEKKEEG